MLTRASSRRGRSVVVGGLVVAGAGAMWALVVGTLAQISLEPTDASDFQAEIARPLQNAGVVAIVSVALGLAMWRIARRRPALVLGSWAAIVVAATALGVGLTMRAVRSHPEDARARALATLVLPAGYRDAGTKLDHPNAITAPAATRTWTTTASVHQACLALREALDGWADPGTVRGLDRTGGCYWSGSRYHHAIDANVITSDGRTVASVRLAG